MAANFVKFAAVTAAGWWFLTFFEAVSWVLLVALLIVPVDIYSVFRGPTKVIVEQQPQVFDALSIAFPLPGEANSAQLGLPDVLFFALFLGATLVFGLRTVPTWAAMTLSFGLTLTLAVAARSAASPRCPSSPPPSCSSTPTSYGSGCDGNRARIRCAVWRDRY